MPKIDIDYSNTVIYKITCKDDNIKDTYVGHTTNFVQRKHGHKQSCINEKSCNHNFKLYKFIRSNGGWNNWKMEIVGFYNCADHCEARIKEQEFFISLNATLNSIEPLPKPKIIIKENQTENSLKIKDTEKVSESSSKFECIFCDYKTCKKSSYTKHLTTNKHKLVENDTKKLPNVSFNCICGKIYKFNSGYYRHKKNCFFIKKENIAISSVETDKKETEYNLIKLLIEQCKELKDESKELRDENKELIQIIKNGTHNTINNISKNKTFNLNFFLNETCKDAMNIMDFVDSIQIQLSELENVGKFGYVEGISNIITKNLKALDVSKRPVHCADKKREVLYVKDENKWEKEDESKIKIRKAIKRVASKNQKLIPKFKEAHPDCGEYYSPFSDQYDNIILESMGGSGDNDLEREDKIIKKITNATIIDKECGI